MHTPRSLEDRAALVTGAARRVGRAVALALADAGMDVAFTFRHSREAAESLAAGIVARGRRALPIEAELAAPEAADDIAAAVTTGFGRLDALVNNASTFEPTPFGGITAQAWDRDMAVNARTPLLLMQALAPLLGAHYLPSDPASPGRIVNFIDVHVLGEPLVGYATYNASKAALMELTASCAMELAPRITVNAIAPGVVSWSSNQDEEAVRREYMRRVPLARPGTPEDAASAVLYLVRDAHYCTGQILKLDGGRALT